MCKAGPLRGPWRKLFKGFYQSKHADIPTISTSLHSFSFFLLCYFNELINWPSCGLFENSLFIFILTKSKRARIVSFACSRRYFGASHPIGPIFRRILMSPKSSTYEERGPSLKSSAFTIANRYRVSGTSYLRASSHLVLAIHQVSTNLHKIYLTIAQVLYLDQLLLAINVSVTS